MKSKTKKKQLQLFPESAPAWDARLSFARAAMARLGEAGRVLSADNEERLKGAVDAINEVLSQLTAAPADDAADDTTAAATEAKRKLVEAWSGAAWDAASGAYLLSSLIELMGDESDEPEQFAMLMTAFNALNQWITAEVAEIGTTDAEDDDVVVVPIFDYEAMRKRGIREAIGMTVPIREGAIGSDGTARLKIIAPGWGATGYYSAEVLERDGPAIFKADTKNFWNHPTLTEEVDRPERDLRDLAGRLTSDAVYEEDGLEGPGLYANAQVTSQFAPTLNELAPFIGVSIRAWGTAHMGEAEGWNGPIIDKLTAAESIDYVTTPGAGGRVLQIFEAAGRGQFHTTPKEAGIEVEPAEAVKLKETNAEQAKEIARLREVHLVRDAKDHIGTELGEFVGIPDVTRARLVESLSSRAKADKEGKLDLKQLDEAIETAVKEEADYLAKATGAGKVSGFGSSDPKIEEKAEAEIETLMKGRGFGLSESEAKVAAQGRR